MIESFLARCMLVMACCILIDAVCIGLIAAKELERLRPHYNDSYCIARGSTPVHVNGSTVCIKVVFG